MFCVGGSVVDDVKAAASQGNVAAAGDVIAVEVKRDTLVLRSGRKAVVRTSVGRFGTSVDEQTVRQRNILQQGDGVSVCCGRKGVSKRLVLDCILAFANLGNIANSLNSPCSVVFYSFISFCQIIRRISTKTTSGN